MSAADPRELARRWAAAEAAHDADALSDLLATDFRGIGPFGFVLDRDQWLRRFTDGLHYDSTELSHLEIREHDAVAVGVGVWDQVAEYNGRPNPGRFRMALTMQRGDDGWSLLGLQLSGPMPDAALSATAVTASPAAGKEQS